MIICGACLSQADLSSSFKIVKVSPNWVELKRLLSPAVFRKFRKEHAVKYPERTSVRKVAVKFRHVESLSANIIYPNIGPN